jgi:F-type H+-transporting ATPase subunit b
VKFGWVHFHPVRLTLVWVMGWMVLAGPASAADDSHAGGLELMIKTAINLVLLLGVIFYFARKPVLEYFDSRRRTIKEDLTGAAAELTDAEATYAKWQRRLIDLETELEEIRTTSRHRAESERERIIADAHTAAERIRNNASAAITQELRRAREQLREEAAQLAIEMAADRLAREVTAADRDRLLDEFIDRVEQGDAPTGSGQRGEA